MSVTDPVMAAMLKPIDVDPLFNVGQSARVLLSVGEELPPGLEYWPGSVCMVLERIPRGLVRKVWSYRLLHINGRTCEFREEELDRRYIQRPTPSNTVSGG